MTNGLKCIGVKTIDELKYSPQVFEDGAIAYTDDKKVYCYVNNKWEEVSDYGTVDKIDDTKANLNLNLYDLNKSLVRSLPDPDTDTLGDYQQKINSYHRILCYVEIIIIILYFIMNQKLSLIHLANLYWIASLMLVKLKHQTGTKNKVLLKFGCLLTIIFICSIYLDMMQGWWIFRESFILQFTTI